jgi:hypothetical protein
MNDKRSILERPKVLALRIVRIHHSAFIIVCQGGGVGLAGNGLAAGGSVVCDYLRVGTDGNADYDLADANEAVIDDGFSSVQVTLGYDAGFGGHHTYLFAAVESVR